MSDQRGTEGMNQEIAVRQSEGLAESGQGRYPIPRISPDLVRPRLPEVGRIRLGEKKGEKGYPAKLEAFRFTSRDRALMEIVAERFGGKVREWLSDEGPQWQVYSDAKSLEVIVPKAELAFSQWFENWDGAVCRRRCDGHREIIGERACVCDPDNRACLPTTRLNVMLPDIPGMGVWRVESHGFNQRSSPTDSSCPCWLSTPACGKWSPSRMSSGAARWAYCRWPSGPTRAA